MPLDPADSALISGAIDNASGLLATGTVNRKTRKWNEKMYDRQRADALTDWNMQNDYNSPTNQMKRLREAGLNPHLVYGNGADATSSSAPRSSSVQSWSPDVAQVNSMAPAFGYMDMQLKQAQIDNLFANNAVKEQDAILRAAQIANTTASTATKKFDLDFKTDLRETSADVLRASLGQKLAQTKSVLDENERRAAMQAPNLQLAAEKILTMRLDRVQTSWQIKEIRQKIENLKKDGTLKQLDIDLKEKGVQPGDALWQRILARLIGGDGGVSGVAEKIKNGLTIEDKGSWFNKTPGKKPQGWYK